MRRLACIWLPQWPIQRYRHSNPAHKRSSVLLYAESPRQGQVVVQATRDLARDGIRVPMPLADAQALLGRRPVQIAPTQPRDDLHALRQLAVQCQCFSPIVGLELDPWQPPRGTKAAATANDRSLPPESLLIDLTGCTHLFGSEQHVAREMLSLIRSAGYAGRVAIADTVGMAWAVAHYGIRQNHSLCLVPAGASGRDLPVEALRLPPEILARLREFDLMRIGQVLDLPRHTLKPRFGSELVRSLDRLYGQISEPVIPETLPQPVQFQETLEFPTTDQRVLQAVIDRLLGEVLAELQPHQHGLLRLQIVLTSKHPEELCIGTMRPQTHAPELRRLIQLQLERLRLRAAVQTISLKAQETAPLRYWQRDLFGGDDQQAEWEFESLVNRLSVRLGPAAVLRAQLLEESQPEQSVQYWPALENPTLPDRPLPFGTLPHRPATLFPEPIPIRVTSLIPYGPPVRFWWNDSEHVADIIWGPERIETGWWREHPIRRDYYRVETSEHRRFWLFRRRDQHDWFLHGCFD